MAAKSRTAGHSALPPGLAVTYRPISDLAPYAANARTHSAEQVAALAVSLTEFGWTNPVLVDGANGIIAGHGRILARYDPRENSAACYDEAVGEIAKQHARTQTEGHGAQGTAREPGQAGA